MIAARYALRLRVGKSWNGAPARGAVPLEGVSARAASMRGGVPDTQSFQERYGFAGVCGVFEGGKRMPPQWAR